MMVLADFDPLVHRLLRALLNIFFLLCCSEHFFPPLLSPGELKIKLKEVILQKQVGPGLLRR